MAVDPHTIGGTVPCIIDCKTKRHFYPALIESNWATDFEHLLGSMVAPATPELASAISLASDEIRLAAIGRCENKTAPDHSGATLAAFKLALTDL